MDLSIIIASFNTKDLLDRCLASIEESLKGSRIVYEVIVIDNGSEDGTVEMVKRKYASVELLTQTSNIGFGKANNMGISKSKGEFVLLLNSDIKALDGGIAKLYQFANKKQKIFIGGKLLNED